MKKIFLLLMAHACAYQLWAQGSLQLTPGANFRSSNGAYLVLDNINIINDGSFKQSSGDGFVMLTGGININLTGTGITIIDKFLMAKPGPATLNLQSNISIVSKVNFSGGLLDLNNSILDLGSTGIFTSETETSRAFTNGSGYVQSSGNLNSPNSVNLGNLGAMITSTANLGATIIRRGHAIQTGVYGPNNSIRRFYDIIPANNQNLKAVLRFYYFDAELNGIPEATLYQWKSKNNVNWDFVGADSRNTSTNYVEKISINKFDRWTLATATPSSITCPANITTSANLNGCKASVAFTATATGVPMPSITYKIGNTTITSPYIFSKGTTTVTATASNGVGSNSICSFTVTVVCGGSSTITTIAAQKTKDQLVDKFFISAIPNPSLNYFTINIKSANSGPVSIRVVDLLGRVLSTKSNVPSNSTFNFGQMYRPGIYFVEAIQGKNRLTLKLVKLE
jgi:hypothetical protein